MKRAWPLLPMAMAMLRRRPLNPVRRTGEPLNNRSKDCSSSEASQSSVGLISSKSEVRDRDQRVNAVRCGEISSSTDRHPGRCRSRMTLSANAGHSAIHRWGLCVQW